MNDLTEIHERLARVENEMANIKEAQTEEKDKLDTIMTAVTSIQFDLSKQKSFMGGVLFTISCLWAFLRGLPLISAFFFGHKSD